jgi:hypothetical protein
LDRLARRLAVLSLAAAPLAGGIAAAAPKSASTVWILTKDGKSVEGRLEAPSLWLTVDGKERSISLSNVLSVHLADPASQLESQRIDAALPAVSGKDRAVRDAAIETLADIGLPAMSPVLAKYKDSDAQQPNPLYNVFARLIPGHADAPNRTLDLVRLTDGTALRGDLMPADLKVIVDGKPETVPVSTIRRLAIRQKAVLRNLNVDSLRHCTQIEFLDTGISTTRESRVDEDAHGFVRLSFDIDGWASDPDGLKVPGPNYKTNQVDGFPFGALVAKIGATGARWFAGKHISRNNVGVGRLYLAVNDNPHWQNNIGSFRVNVRVTNAYDISDPN